MAKNPPEPVAIYTDPEVADIMHTLQHIYAIDDAIYNQKQLNRPEGYINPLIEIRLMIASRLKQLTAKGQPKQEEQPTQ